MSTKQLGTVQKPVEERAAALDEGVVLTDMSLQALAFDEGARHILGEESPGGEASPAAFVALAERLRKHLNGFGADHLPTAKLPFRVGETEYSCRVFVLQPSGGADVERRLALRLQRITSVNDGVDRLAEHYHLTDREHSVLEAIAAGFTSKETAQRMRISPNTVKSFMRVIMLKMGVGSRAGVVGKLLEYGRDADGLEEAGAERNGH